MTNEYKGGMRCWKVKLWDSSHPFTEENFTYEYINELNIETAAMVASCLFEPYEVVELTLTGV